MQEQEQELVGGLLTPATSLDSRSWPQDNVQVTMHQQRVNHHNDSSMLFSTLLSTSSNFQPFTADHNFQMHVDNGQYWNWWGNVSENSGYWSASATHATGTTFPYPPYHTTTCKCPAHKSIIKCKKGRYNFTTRSTVTTSKNHHHTITKVRLLYCAN